MIEDSIASGILLLEAEAEIDRLKHQLNKNDRQMGGDAGVKWEYELMRDMLERATLHLSVPTPECHKTGAMLRQAATVMSRWDRKMVKMEIALTKISQIESCLMPPQAEHMQQIAREALE